MKTNKVKILTSVLLSILVVSCGRSPSSNDGPDRQAEEAANQIPGAIDGSNIQGRYLAKFSTLNPHVVGTIPGSAQFIREDNRLSTFVRLFAGSPSIAHFQNVHSGNRCPTMNDDTNGDGFLDIQETLNVVGPVIIPLDWDIGSQLAGNRSWPKAFPNGSYEYTKTTSFDRFWDDLKSEDKNSEDNIAKLSPDESLVLEGKVVIIQGVDETKTLPSTVAGYKQWTNFQTLPIVCGVLARYTEDPGVVYEEEIPGPIAPVEDGQDRPAGPGEGEDPGTGQVITDDTSNEAGSNDSRSETDHRRDDRPTPTPVPVPNPEPDNEPAPTPEPDSEPRPTPEPDNEPEPDTEPAPEPDTNREEDDHGLPDICWPWENDCI